MSKKGVSRITGNASPKVGEATTYTVADWYTSTPQNHRNPANVTWELFKKRENGRFTTTNIKKTGAGTFTFGEVAHRHTYRIEAYLYESEGEGASTIEINPQPAVIPRINKVELKYVDDTPGTTFSYTEKLIASAETTNLAGQKLKFSLWEDDATGDGHNSGNLLIETKEATVSRQGTATTEFMLTRALMQKAMQGETDPGKLEFYVTVEYFSHNKHATDNVNVDNPLHTQPRPQPRPQTNHRPSQPAQNPNANIPPRAQNSPAAEKPQSQKEEKGILDNLTNWWNGLDLWDWGEARGTVQPQQPPTPQAAGGRTVSIVQESTVEDVIDAYFAKKEFTKKTGEAAGTFDYAIGSNNNKTSTDAEKTRIANIILAKQSVRGLASKKEYTTLEAIKAGLTKDVYNKDEKVTFQTFKLGEEFKKVNSAPLDAKLYLVAKTSGLNGKEATIVMKEKDGLIKGSADAVLPALQLTEQEMQAATPTSGEVPGVEKTEFKGTVENGLVKIPIHLRPKSAEELGEWQKKITKGKQDGTHRYTVKNPFTISGDLDKIAETIEKKSNEALGQSHRVYKSDIVPLLRDGASYNASNSFEFPKYKREAELVYLNVQAQGQKQHNKNFLKADGAYFVVGKSKEIIFPLRVKPENDLEHKWERNYYWAAAQGANQTTFRSNRGGGTRKHAGRDLYTNPETAVVAICKGKVLDVGGFYAQTDQITVLHETNDGRKFVIRYGELAPNSIKLKAGDDVTQGLELGVTGHLVGITVISGHTIYMLHFEHFTGEKGYDLTTRLTTSDVPFLRRTDLVDSLEILQEGYRNTFGEDTGDGQLFTVEDGREAIQELYNKYKDSKWNWKWEGSDTEVEVTGRDLVKIVEKMYRLETAHFGSKQYQNCGTGGMEVFGTAPYYGWDSTLFTEQPVGTWSAFEGAGLSGAGGNAQVTDKKKEFVKLPSVIAGMEYKAKYIIKYNGKYERWFNATDTTAQSAYRTSLVNVRARFLDAIE